MQHTMTAESYKERALRARQRRDQQIPQKYRIPQHLLPGSDIKDVSRFPYESGLMNKLELEITDSTAPRIVNSVSSGLWSATEVVHSFCKRAAFACQLTNCLTEMFFDTAMERAAYLDDYLEREGKVVGPLHGLPISIKDNHQIKGTTTGVGYTSWAVDEVAQENAAIIKLLIDLGAVVYCKTTVPVAMMMPDTDSHIFGPTVNPFNRDHSPGGSSGGESALLAFHGSVIGVGSDIGGSIRIPASLNGIYGLKPTAARFPITGCRSGLAGQHTIKSVIGPLSWDLSSLEFFTKVIWNCNPERYDEACNPIPYREYELPSDRKVVFGVLECDGHVAPSPAAQRALEITINALKRQGHEVIPWEPWRNGEMDAMCDAVFTADGGKFVAENRKDEPLFPYMEAYGRAKEMGCDEAWSRQRTILKFQKEVSDRWNESGKLSKSGQKVDAVICPSCPVPSHPHHQFGYVGYTSYWNVLDYPALCFPVLRADANLDFPSESHTPLSSKDKRLWDTYNVESHDGGFVGLQVVCRRNEDEKVIKLASVVKDSLAQS